MSKFTSIDEYLASVGEAQAGTIAGVIEAVQRAHPDVEVKLAWNVPQLHRGGNYVMGLSCTAKHVSIAPWSTNVMAAFQPRLHDYNPTENLFRVPIDWAIDDELIRDMVHARLAELG